MAKPSTGPGRSSGSGRRNGTPPLGSRPQRVPSQAKSPARLKLERFSVRPLHFLKRLPRLVLPVLLGLLLLGGLLLPSQLAGLLLLVVAVFLGWLLALSWPALIGSARAVRLFVVVIVTFAAFWRLFGYG
ncbi:MAG: hypothetical protein HQ526_08670 [Actinobacteria bacterium]|nr:hypothetical protein [Actinomycetota bacterium]